ncbi:hypothetical protein EAF04_005838 [Stromatinia cepivora]|nr:hypothetical protein EAF04_005838 [Stromatinia cepivora]
MHSYHSLPLGISLLLIIPAIKAQYFHAVTYDAANFFHDFTFFTAADPTEGYVVYEPVAAAEEAGLVSTANNQVYLGVDHTTLNPSGGRESVRLSSNQAWNKEYHMPHNRYWVVISTPFRNHRYRQKCPELWSNKKGVFREGIDNY